jgi:WD40 repeat protein
MAGTVGGHENLVARALVRVLARSADPVDPKMTPVGFGLLVAPGKVVTCAHVVTLSAGEEPGPDLAMPPSGRVLLDFPFVAPGRMVTAGVAAWRAGDGDGSGDVAGLVLDGELPAAARPLALTRGGNVGGHDFQAYGYRPSVAGGESPTWVPGRIIGRTEGGWLQLGVGELTGGLRIHQGFSGTPVWDVQNGQVVGLVTAGVRGSRRQSQEWLAYALSGETIFEAWPDLRESFQRACPFRSLVPFTAADGEVFFGRDELAFEAAEQVIRTEHTIISGASGAGKTSLMNAKVTPELERRGYAVITIRPDARGDSLWNMLAASIAAKTQASFGPDQQMAEERLVAAFSTETLQSRVARLCDALGNDRVVVIVDQYEQLLIEGQPRAGEFTWDLGQLTTVRHPEGRPRIRVVIVVREDHEPGLRALPPCDSCASTVVRVGPLDPIQLRAAIEEPIRRTGFARFEPALVDRIIDEVHVQPYSLPVLQVILTELWERMDPDGLIRHSVYQDLNQGKGPLASHLERRWNELGHEGQTVALRLFLHLVIPIGDEAFARRAASQNEMSAAEWQIAGTLATQRLLVMRTSATHGCTAEFVHDALIEQWPALARHLAAHRDFIQWRDDTRRRMAAWEQSGRHPGQLLSSSELKRGLALRVERTSELSQPEREFLERSSSRRRHMLHRAFFAAVTLLTVVAVLVTIAVIQHNSAVAERNLVHQRAQIALSGQLAAESKALSAANPVTASLLAAAAWRIAPTPQARDSMLDLLAQPERGVLPSGGADTIAFSPAGTILATVDGNSTARLWDVATKHQLGAPFNGVSLDVDTVAFSPDGKILATGGANGIAQLWDVATHHQIGAPLEAGVGTYTGTQGVNYDSVAFSPNGMILAMVGVDGTARLWQTATHRQIGAPLTTGTSRIDAVAFSPSGKILATAGVNGTTQLWNAATRKPLGAPLAAGASTIDAVAFSPSGDILATVSVYGTTQLWNVATHRQARAALAYSQGTYGASVVFSPDGRTLAIAGANDTASLWDLATGAQLGFSVAADTGGVRAMAFSPDGTTLATSGADGTARLWDLATRIPLGAPLVARTGPVNAMAFSPGGRTLVTGGHDGAARLWDLRTRTQLTQLAAGDPTVGVDAVAFSPDGKALVTAGAAPAVPVKNTKNIVSVANDIVRIWDLASHSQIGKPLIIEPGPGIALAFSPNGKTLATASRGIFRLWNVSSHELIARLPAAEIGPNTNGALAFSPNGHTLATADGSAVLLWDVATHAEIGTLGTADDSHSMAGVAFSPDGKTLATWGNPGPVSLWNAATHARIGTALAFGTSEVYTAVFSSDSNILATANLDGTIRLWDVATHVSIGVPLAIGPPIGIPPAGAAFVAFSPDGRTLATVDFPTPVQLWDVALPSDPLEAVCAIAGRSMTRQEWSTYIQAEPFQRVCS